MYLIFFPSMEAEDEVQELLPSKDERKFESLCSSPAYRWCVNVLAVRQRVWWQWTEQAVLWSSLIRVTIVKRLGMRQASLR